MIVHEVEQRSPEWYALRAGKPTASEFSKLITSTGKPSESAATYAITLAVEKFAGKPVDAWEGNSWTERGREMELRALDLYSFAHDVDIAPVGFVTDDDETIGCSPDGLVGTDGLVEVKCLKAENHVKAALYYRKNERCPPTYVQQAQGQMLITGRTWCDVIFYHPELPLLVIRQKPELALRDALRREIAAVLKERDTIFDELRALATGTKDKSDDRAA